MFISIFGNHLDFSKKKIENFDAGQIFFIISILVKIFENLDFVQKFRRTLIFVKIFEKSQFWSFDQNLDFSKILTKITIFFKITISVQILGILDVSSNNLDFGQKFSNYRILSKIVVNYLDFVKIFGNLDFGQNL